MTADQLANVIQAALSVAAGFAAVSMAARFLLTGYRLRKRDQCQVETAPAVAWYKHPDMEPVLAGRASTYVYYITFHTDSGDILKLYLNPTEFYSIEEGSRGILTWQGTRFWKFEQEV